MSAFGILEEVKQIDTRLNRNQKQVANRLKFSQATVNRLKKVSLPNISIGGVAFQDLTVIRLYFFPVDPQFPLD